MMLCDCGERIAEGAVFCSRCGLFLEWEGKRVRALAGTTAADAYAIIESGAPGGAEFGEPGAHQLAPLPAPDPQPGQAGQVGGAVSRQPEGVRRRTRSPVIVPTGSRICASCGMPNQSTRSFCVKCGFSLVYAKIVRKAPWWRRLLGRERVYAAGTRLRPSSGGRPGSRSR
jgi:ribosomal protein S27AE